MNSQKGELALCSMYARSVMRNPLEKARGDLPVNMKEFSILDQVYPSPSYSIPLLDQISISSADDSSSISSCSIGDVEEEKVIFSKKQEHRTSSAPAATSTRCIFQSFWINQQNEASLGPHHGPADGASVVKMTTLVAEHDSPSITSLLKEPLTATHSTAPPNTRFGKRRSIFGKKCWSEKPCDVLTVQSSTLAQVAAAKMTTDRSSTTTLTICDEDRNRKTTTVVKQGTRQSSCLRQPRYSGHNRRTVAASSASALVRFDPDVQICNYERPAENWAAEGWSTWFA